MKKLIFFSLLVLILPFSCKDDDSPSKKELLTSHCWVMTAATVDPSVIYQGAVITDVYAVLPLCNRDNVACILENGNIYVDEGASKCNPDDPQTNNSGKWWFNSDETVILTVLDGSSDTIPSNLLALSKDRLQVRQMLAVFGELRNVTYTYAPE
jgi:hypothetical protein